MKRCKTQTGLSVWHACTQLPDTTINNQQSTKQASKQASQQISQHIASTNLNVRANNYMPPRWAAATTSLNVLLYCHNRVNI